MAKQLSLLVAGAGALMVLVVVSAVLLVMWIIGGLVLSSQVEADKKGQLQALIEQISIGDDKQVVEALLNADPEINHGGASLSDDNIPAGPGIDRWTVTTPSSFDVACQADFVFEADKLIYIVDPWCIW